MINVGDIVSRNKYNNDMLFKVEKIENNIYYLCGIEIRLCADSELSDLKLETINENFEEDDERILNLINDNHLDQREDFFYIYGKILQLDTEFQLTNTLANPYKIRKKAIFENCKNHQK